jgi:hypothetical protein
MTSKENIIRVTTDIREMLLKKNKAYGDSALDPIGIFNKGTATDSLCARIDDKLARIKNRGLNDDTEDTLFDLCGYLILLIIAKEKEDLSTETRT